MNRNTDDINSQGGDSLLRAGRVLLGAVMTPTGAGWARRRTGLNWMRGGLIALLGLGGAVAAYAASQSVSVGAQDRATIESIVHDYLLEHPEVVREAMVRLEQKRVSALVDDNRAQLETPFAGAWEGAVKPDVTLVAFMDYACGYCRATLPALARLLEEDKGLRIVYHELPIISPNSPLAARVSLFAAEQGRFPAFHHAMYAQGEVNKDSVLLAARKAGLDPDKVKAELENGARNPQFAANIKLAQALEAEGTPLLVVGNQIFYGAVSYETLKAAIDKTRKAG